MDMGGTQRNQQKNKRQMGEITMNYEQKHQEDLEAAKGWLAIAKENNNKIAIQILEKFFPELRESEDEKIRKGIIKSIMDLNNDWLKLHGVTRENALTWLEKQGEELDPRYSILDKLIEADTIYQMAMNDEMVQEAKVKAVRALSRMSISEILEFEKQGEQKPSWSEEDEEILDNIITAFKRMSEEDEKISNAIYESIDFLCLKSFGFSEDEVCDWLKSIKPHWKPSKEQMEALAIAVHDAHGHSYYKNLFSLYNVLKQI